jgi:hypothetical protein
LLRAPQVRTNTPLLKSRRFEPHEKAYGTPAFDAAYTRDQDRTITPDAEDPRRCRHDRMGVAHLQAEQRMEGAE